MQSNGGARDIAGYETAQQASSRLGIDDSQVRRLCREGRIPGAVKIGRQWLVPAGSWPNEAAPGPGRPPQWAQRSSSSSSSSWDGLRGYESGGEENERERMDRLYQQGHAALWSGPTTAFDAVISELEAWDTQWARFTAQRLRQERAGRERL